MTLLSQREKATLFMTLLAAFKTLLYRYTGQEYILVGSPIANRNRREIEKVIGLFAHTLVFRTNLSSNPTFSFSKKRPELNAEKFIPNPFAENRTAFSLIQNSSSFILSEHIYKTGDLARYLPDGNIEFMGRSDHQVKIRGFRIELGEIEAAIGQHPALRETVVLVREDNPGDKRLVAYIVSNSALKTQDSELINELRCYLKQKLPQYMMPSVFV
jgi:non-ribosomal peptide synthetase component F